jgi:cobalt-zinc-cadmium efflux system outer membrane protein
MERARQQARQAALPPNPTIGYNGDHIRGGSYGGGQQGAFVQQTVVLGGKLGLRRDVYLREAAAAEVGLEEQTARVHAGVDQAFYHALVAQSLIRVRGSLLDVATDTAATAHQLANLGQADATDVLQSEVEAGQAGIDLLNAQRDYLQAFATLKAVSNQPSLPAAPLNADLEQDPDLNTEEWIDRIAAQSPSVRRAQQEVSAADAEIRSASREPVPDLTVQAGVWHSGEQLDGTREPAGWMSFAQAGVELPLWNRNQGAVAAARAAQTQATSEVTRTQLRLRMQAEQTAQQYISARFQAAQYRRQIIPRARRAYELYGIKYRQMAASYPQVLVAQRTLFDLQTSYLRSLEDEWMAAIALRNYLLTDGLRAPAGKGEHE